MKNTKGITLVALVITIIILLILAGISIQAVTQTNLFDKTKEAKNAMENAQNKENETLINYTEKINEYLPDGNSGDDGESGDDDGKGATATDIKNEHAETYGKKVNYVVKTAENGEIQADKNVGWEVFYSDGTNIYLISDYYIKNDTVPYSRKISGDTTIVTTNLPGKGSKVDYSGKGDYPVYFDSIVNDYTGMNRVPNSIRNLNSKYFNMFTNGIVTGSTKDNDASKASAYLLDIEAWSNYKDQKGKADYAIGAPTLEMLFNSYNETHPNESYPNGRYQLTVTGENTSKNSDGATGTGYAGYQLSADGGKNWDTCIGDKNGLYTDNKTNNLYVITQQTDAHGYWIASPSASGGRYEGIYANDVDYMGQLTEQWMTGNPDLNLALRPVICLNSNAKLVWNENIQMYDIK